MNAELEQVRQMTSRLSTEQKLVDIMFEVGFMIHEHPSFKSKTREDVAAWIATQLKECGYETKPVGSSWGVLQ